MTLSPSWRAVAAAVLFFSAVLAGCRVVEEDGPPPVFPGGGLTVNPAFREFYRMLGGEEVLGSAISAFVDTGSLQIQYTEKTLLCYDPSAGPGEQYSLAPLGLEWGFQDAPLPLVEQPGARIVAGYLVYEEFVPLYDALQGSRFAGMPVTQPHLNAGARRIEQHFENAGFYRSLDDPAGEVHLLAYGAQKCGQACSSGVDAAASVVSPEGPAQVFLSGIGRTGSDLFGSPLSEPYLAADGQIEQVYSGVVISASPADITSIHLRPAAKLAGFPSHPPVERMDDPRMSFYPVDGVLGYNLPLVFIEYIERHGGMAMAGLPVSELYPEGAGYRQCFENYCLDYDPAAAENERIRPAPVGGYYLALYPPATRPDLAAGQRLVAARLDVSEAYPLLSPGRAQEITLMVVDGGTQLPVPGQAASLSVTLPDGAPAEYAFQPTGPDGRSTLTLPAWAAQPGTLFPYRVCLQGGPSGCVVDSYLVWDD